MPTICFTDEERSRIEDVLRQHDPATHPLTRGLGDNLPTADWDFVCDQVRTEMRARVEADLATEAFDQIEAPMDEPVKERYRRIIREHFCPDGPSDRFYAPTSGLCKLALQSMSDERGGA